MRIFGVCQTTWCPLFSSQAVWLMQCCLSLPFPSPLSRTSPPLRQALRHCRWMSCESAPLMPSDAHSYPRCVSFLLTFLQCDLLVTNFKLIMIFPPTSDLILRRNNIMWLEGETKKRHFQWNEKAVGMSLKIGRCFCVNPRARCSFGPQALERRSFLWVLPVPFDERVLRDRRLPRDLGRIGEKKTSARVDPNHTLPSLVIFSVIKLFVVLLLHFIVRKNASLTQNCSARSLPNYWSSSCLSPGRNWFLPSFHWFSTLSRSKVSCFFIPSSIWCDKFAALFVKSSIEICRTQSVSLITIAHSEKSF